jgi:electron transfer flavoprotein alpha subunit
LILALLIHDRGILEESSLQGLSLARSLATSQGVELHAVLIGEAGDGLSASLGDYGVATVHLVHHEGLSDYGPTAWGASVAQLIESLGPLAVVATGSLRGNEVMAHVGAVTGLPLVSNCTEVDPGDNVWEIVRIRWGGSLLEKTQLEAEPKLLTVAEHSVEPTLAETSTDTSAKVFTPNLEEHHFSTRVVDRVASADGLTLATSPVVVSGGRGVGSPEGFASLEELAGLLGGVVGCSRVATNNGWRPHSDQVGQTGTVVAPDLYVACGISGAIQHWVGMMASETILAINTDSEAPMVTKADYAVVGDLGEILPAVIEEINRRKDD